MAQAFADQTVALDTKILYGTSIAETIVEGAHAVEATAIVFTPRGGDERMKLLTEDVTTGLVSESHVPILVLPDGSEGLSIP